MKIAYISDGSIHAAKWVHAVSEKNHEVHLIVLEPVKEKIRGVIVHLLPFRRPLGCILNVYSVRKLLKAISPDILHVHAAGCHGLLGCLVGYHPSILSVTGSDVLVFPKKSLIHKYTIKFVLKYYDHICTTSKSIAKQVNHLIDNPINLDIVPFGVDIFRFTPDENFLMRGGGPITVGTIKEFKLIYGIDILVRSFAKVRKRLTPYNPRLSKRLRLLLVGGGPEHKNIRLLCKKLGIEEVTKLVNWVPNERVPRILHCMDIYVAMSRSEGFGVAILEASACGTPVVVSNVGGLPEVVEDGKTGFIVEKENIDRCADAIQKLVEEPELRHKMGVAGVEFVKSNYEWSKCLKKMMKVYKSFGLV